MKKNKENNTKKYGKNAVETWCLNKFHIPILRSIQQFFVRRFAVVRFACHIFHYFRKLKSTTTIQRKQQFDEDTKFKPFAFCWRRLWRMKEAEKCK